MKIVAANAVLAGARFHGPEEFWSQVNSTLQQVKEHGTQLVLFPGLTGWIYYQAVLGRRAEPAELVPRAAEQAPSFEEGFRRLARKWQLYLCPGSTSVKVQDRYYLAAALFDPQGNKIGQQCQTHLSGEEQAWGLARGEELQVWSTSFGRLGLVVGTDIWHPEVSRILALQGAELVLAPAAVPAPYNRWRQVAAMWQEVQQNQFFALENWLQGTVGTVAFDGFAPILAPCEMTPQETGYLANERKTAWALLDFDRRRQVIAAYPLLKHLNPALYQAHLPGIYERGGDDAS